MTSPGLEERTMSMTDSAILAHLGTAVAAFVTSGIRDLPPSTHEKIANCIAQGASLTVKITIDSQGEFTAVGAVETQDGKNITELFCAVLRAPAQETRH